MKRPAKSRLRALWDSDMTVNEIAKELGVSKSTLKRWLIAYEFEPRSRNGKKRPIPIDLAIKAQEMTNPELAIYYQACPSTTKRWCDLLGVTPKPAEVSRFRPAKAKITPEQYDAAHWLRRFFKPVYSLGRENRLKADLWLVGNVEMHTDEMCELAQRKGFSSDWLQHQGGTNG